MKKNHLFRAAVLTFALGSVLVNQAESKTHKSHRIQQADYTNSAFPTICNFNGTLPGSCTPEYTGIICTVNNNTYYQVSGCSTPYHRNP